jgi:hypothetical protein
MSEGAHGEDKHVVRETLEMLLLLSKLVLELHELLLLALTDGVVLVGFFAALESITRNETSTVSFLDTIQMASVGLKLTLGRPSWGELR